MRNALIKEERGTLRDKSERQCICGTEMRQSHSSCSLDPSGSEMNSSRLVGEHDEISERTRWRSVLFMRAQIIMNKLHLLASVVRTVPSPRTELPEVRYGSEMATRSADKFR